jgi:hypothetical protein
MVTRAFNGIAAGSTVAIGAATICDLYFQHERGLYMGIYTFFLTNGPHVRSRPAFSCISSGSEPPSAITDAVIGRLPP